MGEELGDRVEGKCGQGKIEETSKHHGYLLDTKDYQTITIQEWQLT